MEKTPLGRTGMDVTRVGAGAFAMGGAHWSHAWGEQDDDDSVAALRYAVEQGVNWIDTAAIYGHGHSEEIVARALRDLPAGDRPYVFTKCGIVWDELDWRAEECNVADPASLRQQIESSLRRLGTDHLDLYQVHWPPTDGTLIDDYWGTLLDLKQQGKVRAVGLSNHSVAQLEHAEALGHVDTLQPPFSMIHREAAGDLLPWCHAHNTGVIVYSPMQAGLLTGAFTAERAAALPLNDWRSRAADFNGDGLRRNLDLASGLVRVARRLGLPPGALAVAWTLAFPGVTAAIVGSRRPDQIDGWIGAADLRLGESELAEIAQLITATGAGLGPVSPMAAG